MVTELLTPEQQEKLLAIARSLENEVTLIGASAHIMGIASKPGE